MAQERKDRRMLADRIMALLALAAFTIFFGVIVLKIRDLDLTIAVVIGLLLVLYDLWTQLGPGRSRGD